MIFFKRKTYLGIQNQLFFYYRDIFTIFKYRRIWDAFKPINNLPPLHLFIPRRRSNRASSHTSPRMRLGRSTWFRHVVWSHLGCSILVFFCFVHQRAPSPFCFDTLAPEDHTLTPPLQPHLHRHLPPPYRFSLLNLAIQTSFPFGPNCPPASCLSPSSGNSPFLPFLVGWS